MNQEIVVNEARTSNSREKLKKCIVGAEQSSCNAHAHDAHSYTEIKEESWSSALDIPVNSPGRVPKEAFCEST